VSSINIEVVDVTVEDVPKPKGGTYEKATVVYKGFEGKLESKALMGFATPKEVWEKVTTAKKGDCFSIDREKDPSGKYWNWIGVSRQETPVSTAGPAKAPAKPTYETPEERAQKQVYIIRQSSITNAVNLLGSGASVEEVLTTADRFVNYVMQNGIEFLADDPV
jgi:hypothetical protein